MLCSNAPGEAAIAPTPKIKNGVKSGKMRSGRSSAPFRKPERERGARPRDEADPNRSGKQRRQQFRQRFRLDIEQQPGQRRDNDQRHACRDPMRDAFRRRDKLRGKRPQNKRIERSVIAVLLKQCIDR